MTGAAAPLAAEGVGLALVVAAVAGGVVIVLLLSVEAAESSVVIAGVVRKVALLLSVGVALTSVRRVWIVGTPVHVSPMGQQPVPSQVTPAVQQAVDATQLCSPSSEQAMRLSWRGRSIAP